jgi:hypothetical protein
MCPIETNQHYRQMVPLPRGPALDIDAPRDRQRLWRRAPPGLSSLTSPLGEAGLRVCAIRVRGPLHESERGPSRSWWKCPLTPTLSPRAREGEEGIVPYAITRPCGRVGAQISGARLAEGPQNVAMGFAGEPVPPRIGSGAAVSRKSQRLRSAAASASASRSQLSNRCTPRYRSAKS